MAKALTPQDIHVLMNQLVKEATGQNEIEVVDASSFVSAGELVLATGTENVINSLSIVLGRTFMAVRPYNAKLRLINALNTEMFTSRMRKISFYAKDALASGALNTQLYTNLKAGYDNGENGTDAVTGDPNSTKSMWVQNPPEPLEVNFAGSDTWQDSITTYEFQLKAAFRSEEEFATFVSGIMTEKGNDIESQKEAFNRLAVLQHIAMTYDLDKSDSKGRVINLTKAYNDRFGTSYTSEELRSTHLKDFLAFFVATFKLTSEYMTRRTNQYHWTPAKQDAAGNNLALLRHTPYDRQRVFLYSPLFVEAEAMVFPEIFRPNYLDLDTQYEGVTFWQSIDQGAAIDVYPAIPTANGQAKGDEVSLDYVVGMIFDVDGLMIDYQLDTVASTPLEARKHFRNTWWTFVKNVVSDATENCVIFTMEDESESDSDNKSSKKAIKA